MRGRTVPAVLVLFALLFAGCAQDKEDEPLSKPLETSEAPAPQTTLLRVLVINDEYLPIRDAKVNVIGLGLNSTTDEVGNAYFQIGTPGRYSVHVHHNRFYPNVTKVTIEGDPKQVERVTLLDAPHASHYSDYYLYDGGVCEATIYVEGVTEPRCQDQGLNPRNRPQGWFLGQGLVAGYVRLEWNQQLYGSERMRLEVGFPEAGPFQNGETFLTIQGTSPLVVNITQDLITPEMRKNGVPIEIFVGVPDDLPVAANLYQTFIIDAQFDYFEAAPSVDTHPHGG